MLVWEFQDMLDFEQSEHYHYQLQQILDNLTFDENREFEDYFHIQVDS